MFFLVLVIPVILAISGFANSRYRSAIEQNRRRRTVSGLTGGQVAQIMLDDAGASDIKVVEWDRRFSDRYDPLRRTVALSSEVFRGRSIAAVGIAAHETGHAVQHFKKHRAFLRRMTVLRATELLPAVAFILPFGLALVVRAFHFKFAALLAGCTWVAIMIANLLTLPVEWNASERALNFVRKHRIVRSGSELADFESVLAGANWAGVGMFSKSFSYLLYNLLPFMGRRNYRNEAKAAAEAAAESPETIVTIEPIEESPAPKSHTSGQSPRT